MKSVEQYLKETSLLDYSSPNIQELIIERQWKDNGCIYSFEADI